MWANGATLAVSGRSREDLMERPVVGILNTWSDINPCNLNLRDLAQEVRTGILEAGGVPFEAPLMSLSENIIKPTSFPFRNLLSMEAEECIRAYPFDAVVLLGGCDKTQPALLMGAASAGVPMIFLGSGPATPRAMAGASLGNATSVWRAVDELRSGKTPEGQFAALERNVMGAPGHCAEMGTASSMAVVCEALGVSLPGSSLIPAADSRRTQVALAVGRNSVRLAATGGPAELERRRAAWRPPAGTHVRGYRSLQRVVDSLSDGGDVQFRAVDQARQPERRRIDARRVVHDELRSQIAKARPQTETVA